MVVSKQRLPRETSRQDQTKQQQLCAPTRECRAMVSHILLNITKVEMM